MQTMTEKDLKKMIAEMQEYYGQPSPEATDWAFRAVFRLLEDNQALRRQLPTHSAAA